MGITFGGTDTGMPKKGLNVTDVGAVFKEMGGKGMAEAVDRDFFGDFGAA
jgi:hypothetical protein